MNKDQLIESVKRSCNGDDISKRLTEDVVCATFENIRKAIKQQKRFSYPGFGTFW